ncbi:MAG: hypothetical protein LQ352_004906 [Teloschistes flavicans]|nr:MAG: hypothetical protein LQ352_004906 [Teloschistes flavicans]
MHFSAAVVLSSIFTLTLALPAPQSGSKAPAPGRLNVNYNFNKQTLSSGSKASSNGLSMIKASAPFTIKAYNSESPIHMMDINVSYNKFWVGNATNSTCPEDRPGNPPQPCPVGNITALLTTSTGGAQMDSGVFGGQAVYIGPRAQLRFNPPSVPIGQDVMKVVFALQPNPIPAPPGIAAFTFSGVGKASGYLACPVAPKGPWQVFADLGSIRDSWVPSGDVSDCIGFDALATDYTSALPAAYEYV